MSDLKTRGSKTKFLVVDDVSTMRKIIKNILTELGYTNLVEAVDGANALEVLASNGQTDSPVQFIISDWNMPNMMGIDLLKHCKKTPEYRSLPFILVTAESEQHQILEAVKAGVSDYIVKPFSAQKVKEKIERVHSKLQADKKVA